MRAGYSGLCSPRCFPPFNIVPPEYLYAIAAARYFARLSCSFCETNGPRNPRNGGGARRVAWPTAAGGPPDLSGPARPGTGRLVRPFWLAFRSPERRRCRSGRRTPSRPICRAARDQVESFRLHSQPPGPERAPLAARWPRRDGLREAQEAAVKDEGDEQLAVAVLVE